MITGEAGLFQAAGLFRIEKAERGAELDRDARFHPGRGFAQAVELLRRGLGPARHQSTVIHPRLGVAPGVGEHFVHRLQGIDRRVGAVVAGLGAKAAIFLATPGFGIYNTAGEGFGFPLGRGKSGGCHNIQQCRGKLTNEPGGLFVVEACAWLHER